MIYVIEHTIDGDIFRYYEGMTQEAVESLISASGNEFSFVDELFFKEKESENIAALNERRIAAGLSEI